VLQLVSGRRGQILGYEARGDWRSWDKVTAYPSSGDANFVELRSLTLGVGSFSHLTIISGSARQTAERVCSTNGNGHKGA